MVEKNMIDNFFQQLEEKVMLLLSEREDYLKERANLIKETQRLSHENSMLKNEQEQHKQKLEGIVSLLETINVADKISASNAGVNVTAVKLDLIQG